MRVDERRPELMRLVVTWYPRRYTNFAQRVEGVADILPVHHGRHALCRPRHGTPPRR